MTRLSSWANRVRKSPYVGPVPFASIPRTDHCGVINCSRPSLLTSFREVLVPRARIWTCVGFDSPPKLTADPSSVAAILTWGPPSESISRRSTVRIGLATADRPLEGAPRKDAAYGAIARRIEKPSNVILSGANLLLNVCSLARGGCSPICHEFVTLPGT